MNERKEYNIIEAVEQLVKHNKTIVNTETGDEFYKIGIMFGRTFYRNGTDDEEINLDDESSIFSIEDIMAKYYIED